MSGRLARWIALGLILLALGLQGRDVWRQREAAHLRRQVEAASLAQAASGRVIPAWIARSLRDLRQAAELDPLDPGIPMLVGGQYLLLNRPQEAIEAYEEALALEPRPEFYLNLGRALTQAGDEEGAREAFRKAVVLDWRLQRHVPPQ